MDISQLVYGEQDGFYPFGYALSEDPFEWSDSELISWCRGQLTTTVSTNKVFAEIRRRWYYPSNWQNSAIRADVAQKGLAVKTHGYLFMDQALERITTLANKTVAHNELYQAMLRALDLQYENFEEVWTELLEYALAHQTTFNERTLFVGTAQMSLTTGQYRTYIRLLTLVLETMAPANRYKVNRVELRSSLDGLGLSRYLKLAKFYKLL